MSALESYGIKYLIIGGIAVGFYTEPRFTKDLDVLIAVSPEDIDRLFSALRDFGAPLHMVSPADFLQEDFVLYLGSPPWRIDILTSAPGIDFAEAYKDKKQVLLGGVRVNCISKEWLIKSKQASGRNQDLADLDALQDASS
ncbi:MAG TPA: DUF6036 family nucleotidyltransferase [Fimbriimonas sp.]|nr:DUF6036 family nucleotidyltransferase [Fimbriimonas sp.]